MGVVSLKDLCRAKDWLAYCQDNVTEWDSRSWYWQPDFPMEQHCKLAMRV